MKSKEELVKMALCILAELQSGSLEDKPMVKLYNQTRLELLYNILGDDMPEEFWSQIEEQI